MHSLCYNSTCRQGKIRYGESSLTLILMYDAVSTALTTRQLTLAYDRSTIIRDLSLAIPANKITVLAGANGCGKSTLLKGLGRLLKPKSGTVYLDGTSIFKLSTKVVAKKLGLLPQGPSAPEGLTVRELIS